MQQKLRKWELEAHLPTGWLFSAYLPSIPYLHTPQPLSLSSSLLYRSLYIRTTLHIRSTFLELHI